MQQNYAGWETLRSHLANGLVDSELVRLASSFFSAKFLGGNAIIHTFALGGQHLTSAAQRCAVLSRTNPYFLRAMIFFPMPLELAHEACKPQFEE
jgi:hypothetical protein